MPHSDPHIVIHLTRAEAMTLQLLAAERKMRASIMANIPGIATSERIADVAEVALCEALIVKADAAMMADEAAAVDGF